MDNSEESNEFEKIQWLSEWNNVKHLIKARTLKEEEKQIFLKDMPHKSVGNVIIVFSLEVKTTENIIASVFINYNLLKTYGIDENTLFEQAIQNSLAN